MRTVAKVLIGVFAALGFTAAAAVVAALATGASARRFPSAAEVRLARATRHLLIPAAARGRVNPRPATPESLASARAHWADHCAPCHGNDGKGQTAMGRNLHPRAPDMTAAATQELSDGELHWIIENGVRLTGMPAWGTGEAHDEEESWDLVHFVRRLPRLTAAELAEMRRLNPTSRAELEQELAIERFLAGEDAPPAPPDHRH